VDALGLADRAKVVRSDATSFLGRAPESSFDLVLCDPPYALADRLPEQLDAPLRRALAPGGRVMVETAPGAPALTTLPLLTERAYGDTLVRIHAAEVGE
jgi:16S rRNA G966 N2-methylase RsmD